MHLTILYVTGVFCVAIWILKFIDGRGAIVSGLLIVGSIFLGSPREALIIILVYACIVTMSRFRRKQRKDIYQNVGQTDIQKGILNVIGKVLLPVLAASLDQQAAFAVVLAYGIADSAGSQVGVFSSAQPVLVSTFRRVPAGTNGAISLLGTALGALLGISVAALYAIAEGKPLIWGLLFGILGGLVGNMIDSFCGATAERRFKMPDWSVNLVAGATSMLIAIISEAVFIGH